MIMTAVVLRAEPHRLLVKNERNGQEVWVFARNPGRFSPGDRVRILYNGQVTMSIPPQISATAIRLLSRAPDDFPVPHPPLPHPPHPPLPHPSLSEMRAVVLQTGRDFLLVRQQSDRRTFHVHFPFAHHFCVRQRIVIRYDTITMSDPPRIHAIDITPRC